MTNSPRLSGEEQRKRMESKIWLLYCNDQLMAQGLITPEERDRMKYRINEKYSLATPSNPPRSIQ